MNASALALTALTVCSWTSTALAQRGGIQDPSAALTDEQRRVANEIPNENTPRPGEHYPVSNEWRHDLWFPRIRDLGGAFVGVGSDQCYTLAAAQNARMLWVVDFDPLVPLVHRMYSVLVPASETPEALLAKFAPEHRDATRELLRRSLANDPQLEAILGAFDRNGDRMHGYLTRVSRNRRGGGPGSWLADPELYRRVRVLHSAGRVIARNGDVTNPNGALAAVGRAAQRLQLPLRVIYFSNAEQFFGWTGGFRANLEALHADDRAVVLRTFRGRDTPYPDGDRWHYLTQPLSDLRARIAENGYRHSRQAIMDLRSQRGALQADGESVLDPSVPRRYASARRDVD